MTMNYIFFGNDGSVSGFDYRWRAVKEGLQGYDLNRLSGNWYDLNMAERAMHIDDVPKEIRLKALLLV